MKLIKLDLDNTSIKMQGDKVVEEFAEWIQARTLEDKLEESWDVIQAMLHYILKHTHEEVRISNREHIKKLEYRESKGGHVITHYVKLKFSKKTGEESKKLLK